MEQAMNKETQLAESAPQEPALAQSSSNVLHRHIKENPKKAVLARHRLWLDSIPHEYPMPYTPYKIGVYIRYFNQTRHEELFRKAHPAVYGRYCLVHAVDAGRFLCGQGNDRPAHGVL